jgi:tetratricopeptide (TPR) repeat protein
MAAEEARQAEELEALTHAYTALDGSYQMLGEPDKAVHERMSVDILTKLGNTRQVGIVELNLGVQAHADGRWDEAVDLFLRAQRDCTRAGDRQHTAIAGASLAEVLIERGSIEEAERILVEARRALRASGFRPYALFTETQLARIDLERGDAGAALESLTRILQDAAEMNHAGIALEIAVYFAHAATAAGFPDRGLSVLAEAASAAGAEATLLSVPVDRVRGIAHRALGRLDEAAKCFERALLSARKQSLLYEQLLLLRERAILATQEGAEPDWSELREARRLAQLLKIEASVAV